MGTMFCARVHVKRCIDPLKPAIFSRAAATVPAVSSSVEQGYNLVKFQKEDVETTMQELPHFDYYVIKESTPNPYKGSTLDRSILLDHVEPKLVAPKVEFSKLENGFKIASIDKQGLAAHLALYVNAGSRYESADNFGVSHMAAKMAFKSTAHLSHLRTVKTLETLGADATTSCVAGREDICYKTTVPREFLPFAVPLLVGNVLFPRLLPWEVKPAHDALKADRVALQDDPHAHVNELLYKTAYCNNTLGHSPVATERALPYFTPETVRSFMLDHFAPERMVLVGVNVAHADLAKWSMRSFVDYNAIPLKERAEDKAVYTGGDVRADSSSPNCHIAIAFESASWQTTDRVPVAVLGSILGIGQGSLVSTRILSQNPYVESCSAFNLSHTDSGLFGVYGVVQPTHAGEFVHGLTAALGGLKDISEDQVVRAKAVLKGELLRKLDEAPTLMEDIGKQVLLSGTHHTASDLVNAIDAVDVERLRAAADRILATKPTLVAVGDTHAVPHYSVIENSLA